MVSTILLPLTTAALTSYDKESIYNDLVWLPDDANACSLGTAGLAAVRPGNVYLLGDSLSERATSQLQDSFTGEWSIDINAEVGRQSSVGASVIDLDKDRVFNANAIVVALGTNDEGSDISSNIEAVTRAIHDANGSAPIFWVDVASTQADPLLNGVNKYIHENALTFDYSVISWFKAVFPSNSPTGGDTDLIDSGGLLDDSGYHQTTDGNAAFADTIFSAISTASKFVSADMVSGADNRATTFNYFVLKGLTPAQSAGIVGNFMAETKGSMSPSITQGDPASGPYTPFRLDNGKGYGLAQWTSLDRKEALQGFAAATGRAVDSLAAQLDFTWYELTGEPPVTGVQRPNESNAYNKLLETQDVEDATVAFHRYYERSSGSEAEGKGEVSYEAAFGPRIGYAEKAFAELSGQTIYSATTLDCNETSYNLQLVSGDTPHIPCQGDIFRDRGVEDGYKEGQLVLIRVCVIRLANGEEGPHVNSQISAAISQMFNDAWASGVELRHGSSFRTMAAQISGRSQPKRGCGDGVPLSAYDIYEAPANTCDPPTERPGYSNHQMGYAIDFTPQIGRGVEGPDGVRTATGNEFWEWLKTNAHRYDMEQLASEAWHWSVDGH